MTRVARTQWPAEKLPVAGLPPDLPILYEDEEEGDMGEANLHLLWTQILHCGVKAHVAPRPELHVYANMNLYYRDAPLHPITKSRPNISPDVMVVRPFAALPEAVVSFTIGEDGPAPLWVAEVLSDRSAQQRDLGRKLDTYAGLGVAEYVLADPTGLYLPERLLLKRLLPDGSWKDEKDADGGVTSNLQFRIVVEPDNLLQVVDGITGWHYVRPDEADLRVRELNAELQRLRRALEEEQTTSGKKAKGIQDP